MKTSKTRDIAKWTLGVQFGKWSQDLTSISKNLTSISKKCGNGKSWFGWNEGTQEGMISAKLSCDGTGTLNFGNCGTGGSVKVYLQDIEIGSANENSINNIITFEFKHRDVLKLQQKGPGAIILFNSFHAHPTGIFICSSFTFCK